MSSLLTDGLNCGSHYTDCKQNGVIRFQIINLSFTGRKRATFDVKVARFFIKNKCFITPQTYVLKICPSCPRLIRNLHIPFSHCIRNIISTRQLYRNHYFVCEVYKKN